MNLPTTYLGVASRVLSLSILGPVIFPFHALLFKVLRAEGVLLAVNLSLLLVYKPGNFFYGVKAMLLSTLVLAQLYAFNDVHDAANDVKDPDKPAGIAALILKKHSLFMAGVIAWAAALAAAAYFFMPDSFYGTLVMFALNTLYSTVFKGLPVMDVIIVGAWGTCFPMLLGLTMPFDLLVIVGGMTGVSHIWQTMRDQTSDTASGITTVAVFSRFSPLVVAAILCLFLAGVTANRATGYVQPAVAVLSVLPLVFYAFWSKKIRQVWVLSKIVFAFIWFCLLYRQT
jgi:4-hydroxybenzoate polyprenyltransferase